MANGNGNKPYRPGSDQAKDLRIKMLEEEGLRLDEAIVEEQFQHGNKNAKNLWGHKYDSPKNLGDIGAKHRLNPITSLPEPEEDNRTSRQKKAQDRFIAPGMEFLKDKKLLKASTISGMTSMSMPMKALELSEDTDLTPYIEGGIALEEGYIERGDPGSVSKGINRDLIIPEHIPFMIKMRETGLDKDLKKYQQQLYDSRSWWGSATKGFGRLSGLITTNVVGGILGTLYGAGRALFTWDLDNFFKGNQIFEATEWATGQINRKTLVYGKPGWDIEGYDDEGNPIRKSFVDRFLSDPGKSFSEDLAPAVGFVGGAVASELLLSMLTVASDGAAAPALAANTARLAAQGSRLMRGYSKARNLFRLKINGVRGLGATDELTKMAGQIDRVKKFRQGLGTTRAMITSTGYESALIAESTRERVLEQLTEEYKKENNGEEPTTEMLAKFNQDADKAGRSALLINTLLVGSSNMLQFPKLFRKGYTGSRNAARGLKRVDGKWVSKVLISRALLPALSAS